MKKAIILKTLTFMVLGEFVTLYSLNRSSYAAKVPQKMPAVYDGEMHLSSGETKGYITTRRLIPNQSYKSYIETAARKYNLEPELLMAVIKVESGFNPRAKSWKGAQGLMQLMPDLINHYKIDAYQPDQNIEIGTMYLAQLQKRFGGDLKLALAAYNAGPGKVRYYGRIPPYPATHKYVRDVLRYFEDFKKINSEGV